MKLSETLLIGLVGTALLTTNACTRAGHAQTETDHSLQTNGVAEHQQVVEISVTSEGFVPAKAKIRAGYSVKLIVTRNVERTCATEFVIKDYGINKPLPLNVPVDIIFTPTKSGPIRYSCAMNMIAGELVAE